MSVNPASNLNRGSPQPSKTTSPSSVKSSDESPNQIVKIIQDDRTKKAINLAFNGGASLLNLLTFINGNFNLNDAIQEKLELLSEVFSRLATGTQGFILAADTVLTKNIIPLIGYALEIPIAIFSSADTLWRTRGISQGLGQFYRIIDQREKVDESGNTTVIGGDFSENGNNLGIWGGLKTTVKEIYHLMNELIKKPSEFKNLPHALCFVSIFQALGGLLGVLGIKTTGAIIRDIAGVGVDYALMRDKNVQSKSANDSKPKSEEPKGKWLDLNSMFVQAGLIWIGASIADLFKIAVPLREKIQNLTNLSLFFDRGASLRLTQGYLSIKRKNELQITTS